MNDLISKKAVIDIIVNEIKNTRDYLQHDTQINIQFAVEELPIIESVSKDKIYDIIKILELKASEHEINSQEFNSCGWFTYGTEEYGKRDGLYEAIEVIKKIVKETE